MWGTESWGEMIWGGLGNVDILVPSLEPAALLLLALGLIGCMAWMRASRLSRR